MVWGEGVDPANLLSKTPLEQSVDEAQPEGQHMFPELADLMAAVAPKPKAQDQQQGTGIEITSVRYKVFNVGAENDRKELEGVMTMLAQGKGCVVCREESTFTKEGSYIVALKWMEYKVPSAPAPELIVQEDPPGSGDPDTEGEQDDVSSEGSLF